MTIIEIWVPEAIVVFFLALPLFRPFVKILWPMEGLVWLPLIALGIAVGIFPAYGFRPECLPILVFAFVHNFANLSPLISSIVSRPDDSFRDRGPLLTVLVCILLSAAAFPLFAFSSRAYQKPEGETEPIKEITIRNRMINSTGIFYRNYSLRIYGPVQKNRPLIILMPPEIGSAASVDIVCTELQKRNFTVVTYSHEDDNPLKKQPGFPVRLMRYWRIYRKAADIASVNEQGKALENQRRTDIEFLLSELPALLDDTGKGKLPPLLLAGYDAGGSALAYLAGERDFISRASNVLGVVAIESRLWSSYLPESRNPPDVPAHAGIILRRWTGMVSRLAHVLPQRVNRSGPLPGAGISLRGLPVLYLVSGRALDSKKQKPYQAVFDSLRSGLGRVVIAAIQGAGPLDYQDFSFTYPLYSFLLPGLKDAQKSEDPIGDTVGIIGNFASFLLEQAEDAEETDITIPPRYDISGSLYVESKGLPGFRL
ncbi:MAG: hypothetical protein LBH20_11610 [Treponema sp.]|jgi:hypothetical protein|nr:hypothetical protein [Treponema sp.]